MLWSTLFLCHEYAALQIIIIIIPQIFEQKRKILPVLLFF